jgi:hypothetical protein
MPSDAGNTSYPATNALAAANTVSSEGNTKVAAPASGVKVSAAARPFNSIGQNSGKAGWAIRANVPKTANGSSKCSPPREQAHADVVAVRPDSTPDN